MDAPVLNSRKTLKYIYESLVPTCINLICFSLLV
jgi:hypothetical protein